MKTHEMSFLLHLEVFKYMQKTSNLHNSCLRRNFENLNVSFAARKHAKHEKISETNAKKNK